MATSQFTAVEKPGPRPTLTRASPRRSGVTRCFCIRASISTSTALIGSRSGNASQVTSTLSERRSALKIWVA
jgi:hypothetical protein